MDFMEKTLLELISVERLINYDDAYLHYIVVIRPFRPCQGWDVLADTCCHADRNGILKKSVYV